MKRLPVEPLTDDERHRLRLVLRNSTPAERLEWLEHMRLAFGPEHIKKCRDLKFRMQDAQNPFILAPPHDR